MKAEAESKSSMWEVIDPDLWKPQEENDSIEGKYVKTDDDIGQHKSKLHFIETEDGLKKFWGCKILDDKLECINKGDIVRVIFLEKKKNDKGQMTNYYEVLRRKS